MGGAPKIKQTASEKELARISSEQWNDYQRRFVPMENQFIADSVSPQTEAIFRQRALGAINADAAQVAPRGFNPNTGVAAVGAPAINMAKKVSAASTAAGLAVKDRKVKALEGAVAMGRGQAANVNVGMQGLAEAAQQRAFRENAAESANKAFIGNTIGQVVGSAAAFAGAKKTPPATPPAT